MQQTKRSTHSLELAHFIRLQKSLDRIKEHDRFIHTSDIHLKTLKESDSFINELESALSTIFHYGNDKLSDNYLDLIDIVSDKVKLHDPANSTLSYGYISIECRENDLIKLFSGTILVKESDKRHIVQSLSELALLDNSHIEKAGLIDHLAEKYDEICYFEKTVSEIESELSRNQNKENLR